MLSEAKIQEMRNKAYGVIEEDQENDAADMIVEVLSWVLEDRSDAEILSWIAE